MCKVHEYAHRELGAQKRASVPENERTPPMLHACSLLSAPGRKTPSGRRIPMLCGCYGGFATSSSRWFPPDRSDSWPGLNRIHQIRGRGFSFCPCNAHDFQFGGRISIKIPRNLRQELAGVRNGNECSLRTGGDFAFGGHCYGAVVKAWGMKRAPSAFSPLIATKRSPF